MGHFQHQRAISQQHMYKREHSLLYDPKGLMDFSRGKTLGRGRKEGWPGLWEINQPSYRSSIYTYKAHLHLLYSEIDWAGATTHVCQLRKLRL